MSEKCDKQKQIRLDDDVVALLARYAKKFPIKVRTGQMANGLLRDILKTKLTTT